MNILIVEDEKVAARRLMRIVKEILGDKITTINCVGTLVESEQYIEDNQIDLLLLDLNLDGDDGFELLKNVAASSFQTVIVSANTDKAIDAYEYGVLDFIPKPFEKSRVEKTFERLMKNGNISGYSASVLAIKKYGKVEFIQVSDIKYFKGAGDYVEIHLSDGNVVLHSKSLESLEQILPSYFVRVHKSYLTDIRDVSTVHVYGGGKYEIETMDGTIIPVSRNRYKEISEKLTDVL